MGPRPTGEFRVEAVRVALTSGLPRKQVAADFGGHVIVHDAELERLVTERAPSLMDSHGIATLAIAEMLILVGNDATRIRSEAAFAKLCWVCPIAASSGKTRRFRLNRGGNRQANAALYRAAIVRMRSHEPTLAYVKKRTKDGKSKSEIIRCLKR